MNIANIKPEVLLETHELPFAVINSQLMLVAVNRAWETLFNLKRDQVIGQIVSDQEHCKRYHRFFKDLKPYGETIYRQEEKAYSSTYRIKGVPLVGSNGEIFLAESITPVMTEISGRFEGDMIGVSGPFKHALNRMMLAAQTDMPVLLTGETGTGKDLAAHFIHQYSRQAGQLVILDCTLFNQELFESELFGHEKGAFTGANQQKKGLIEVAEGGTLFLDEIGELPLEQQSKLLRVLESGQYRRVGGLSTMRANVRVIAATHRNLAQMVRNGQFREDLFYRLSIFPVELPALRQRREDIMLLARFFSSRFGGLTNKSVCLSPGAMKKLLDHRWPGNIRELKNCIQLAVGLTLDGMIGETEIQFMASPTERAQNDVQELKRNKGFYFDDFEPSKVEKEYIMALLQKHHDKRKACADEMNVSERTFYRKLKKYELLKGIEA
jgi:transcriptional regulator with PAS, ATPase and Fis domain